MAILDVIKYGDPVLRQTAEPYANGEISEIFVQDMIETISKRDGVGLAAPQVGVSKRFIVATDMSDLYVIVNPEIVAFSEHIAEDFEGCLSLPGIQGKVPRYSKVVVKGHKPGGTPFEITARGLLSRVLQHEIDHLRGVLFIDRTSPESLAIAEKNDTDDEIDNYREVNIEEIKSIFRKEYHQDRQYIQFDSIPTR